VRGGVPHHVHREWNRSCRAYDPAVVDLLDDDAVDAALHRLPEWSREGDTLNRTYQRRDWPDAVALLNAVADEAERRNHHPDVCITGYRTITFRLTTHAKGGITNRDVDLATWIEERASQGS
jgi:4a-hydroxytetrahydrobiopterin dehydratase